MVVTPDNSASDLESIVGENIKTLYTEHGAVLFRGFALEMESFKQFCDQYCGHFIGNKSPGREQVSKDGRVQTVNLGLKHFPLHPEMAREPWQPDIAWFACEQPAESMGQTTICDGISVFNAFSESLQQHLKSNTLAHTQPTDLAWCREFYRQPNLELGTLLNNVNTYPFKFSSVDTQLYRSYFRPMVHQPMFSSQLAYGNFLVFARQNLGVKHFPCYADGTHVADELVAEIAEISNRLAVNIDWQKNDILMLDNTRFMHGRNDIGGDPRVRKIYTQFGYCSFVPEDYPDLSRQFWRQP